MKKGILFLLVLITAVTGNAQSLKDALYGGKLKTDTGAVLRKGEDLSSKIDTTTRKKPSVAEKNMAAPLSIDSMKKWTTKQADTVTKAPDAKNDNNSVTKDNNKTWKTFTDAVIGTLNTEVMTSKKMKNGDYYVMVDYEIGLEGQVNITNVFVSPENKFLAEQVKERFSIDTPKLNPVLSANGKPRKTVKRSNFTLSKN